LRLQLARFPRDCDLYSIAPLEDAPVGSMSRRGQGTMVGVDIDKMIT